MTKASIDFARAHLHDDTARLLLSAARYPDIDMPAAVQQIEGLLTAAAKWPSLLQCADFVYPPRLNREQASSEATARYKASLLPSCSRIADLTGGMGIDTLALATARPAAGVSLPHIDYVEREPDLCFLMEHNLQALDIANVSVHCVDCMAWIEGQEPYDLIYIDPARRSAAGRRVAAFEECTPNLPAHLPLLRSKGRRLLVKASPMIDIHRAVEQLGTVGQVHIVGVQGECKEVLFLCGTHGEEPVINCIDLSGDADTPFSFTFGEECSASTPYSDRVERYLYDPHAALRKAGCFHLLGRRYGLPLLGPNTHLYTSPTLQPSFPGRIFEVLREVPLDRKAMKTLLPDGKAHVMVRNFPTEAATLQKQLGLREGGDLFLVATTVATRHTALLCQQLTAYNHM